MQRHGGVTHAAALLVDNELWGFACPRTVDVEDVRRAAAMILPYYAVPTRLVLIDTMPLTRFVVHLRVFRLHAQAHENAASNGKADKAALRTIAVGQPKTAAAAAASAERKWWMRLPHYDRVKALLADWISALFAAYR
jgi:hypothetical protein